MCNFFVFWRFVSCFVRGVITFADAARSTNNQQTQSGYYSWKYQPLSLAQKNNRSSVSCRTVLQVRVATVRTFLPQN